MRLAFVVGHTRIAPGLFGVKPLGQYEYLYNSDLAEKMAIQAEALGVEHEIFFRDGVGIAGAYQRVNFWKADAVIELHFNGFDGTARGSRTLFGAKVSQSPVLAAYIQDAVSALFSRSAHDNRGCQLLQLADRGFLSVNSALAPSVLVEPFFGDNAEDAALGVLRKDGLAVALVASMVQFLKAGGGANESA